MAGNDTQAAGTVAAVWQEMTLVCPFCQRPSREHAASRVMNIHPHRRFPCIAVNSSALRSPPRSRSSAARAARPARRLAPAAPLPKRKRVRVAFMLGDARQRDRYCRPLGSLPGHASTAGRRRMRHSSSTRSRRRMDLLEMTGGLKVKPHYSIKQRATAQRHRRSGAQVHRGIARLAAAGERRYRRDDVGLHGRVPARPGGTADRASRRRLTTNSSTVSRRNSRTSSCGGACASSTAATSRPPAGSPPASTSRCTSSRATSASQPPRRRRLTWSTRATPGGAEEKRGQITFSQRGRSILREKVTVPFS